MSHPRERFWEQAHAILLDKTPWTQRKAAILDLVHEYDQGHALLEAGPRPDANTPTKVSHPLTDEEKGYRCFLKSWELDEETGIHGHPHTMFVYVMSAELESIAYQRQGDYITHHSTKMFQPGQTMTGCVDNARYDNFIHNLRCTKAGWSLHMYSDWGGRGERFEQPEEHS